MYNKIKLVSTWEVKKMKWVKIKRNDNYSINENGEVRNDNTGRIKSAFVSKGNGYLMIDLWENNKSSKVPLHRLIAEAFIPNPNNKPCVDHIDGNRQNNAIENLRWATYSENNSRFETVGVRSEKIKVIHYEEQRKKRGGGHEKWLGINEILVFDRIIDVAEHFNVTISNISLMLEKGTIGRRGKMRGYKFEYLNGERKIIS